MTEKTENTEEAVAWVIEAPNGNVRLWTQSLATLKREDGVWDDSAEPLFPLSSLTRRDERIAALEARLAEAVGALEKTKRLVEGAFHQGRESCFGTDRHRAEDAWRNSRARQALSSVGEG